MDFRFGPWAICSASNIAYQRCKEITSYFDKDIRERKMTIIMNVHRLTTVRNADQILAVDEVRIVHQGSTEVMQKKFPAKDQMSNRH